ncbi:hypothetical protein KUTeg_006734 [Tegillarca granosa]|uniref:Transposase Helix-turn-helix domain-containing protein n=1 Tax=Tegillarca granosa TaxID=220873 RepID=A0ABQ9FB65_TEGGR|nr:hypothetical protein KUTeg_006734 [Tegillarca granosa]
MYVEDVVPTYVTDDIQRFFRVKRLTFEIICRNISEYSDLEPKLTGGRQTIPIDKQLLIVLYYLSGQETLNRIADRFNVTESFVVSRLQYIDTYSIQTAVDLILVCCIIHNICIINEDELLDVFHDNNIQPAVVPGQIPNDAEAARKK